MFSNRPLRPETMIIRRVRERMEELGLNIRQVSDRVANSDLYGTYTYGSFRNLLTQNFEDDTKPRDTMNKQLVIALSEALECDVYSLANHRELEAIREIPYRKAQWPEFMLAEESKNEPRTSVASPELTAKRIYLYAQLYGYRTITDFYRLLHNHSRSKHSEKTIARTFGRKADPKTRARVITYEFCEQVAEAFRFRLNMPFDPQWFLKCREDGRCPHCYPDMINL